MHTDTMINWQSVNNPDLNILCFVHKTFPIGIKPQEKCEILNGGYGYFEQQSAFAYTSHKHFF